MHSKEIFILILPQPVRTEEAVVSKPAQLPYVGKHGKKQRPNAAFYALTCSEKTH